MHELIVVDNGSTDNTAEVATRHGARVIKEPVPGYGRSCLSGIAALSPAVDIIAFMDADHSDYPEELSQLLQPILAGEADMVIGSRVHRAQAGSLTIPQRFGNALACSLMRWLFRAEFTDLGPFRAIRRSAYHRLKMQDKAFGWTVEMQAKAARIGLKCREVPVGYRKRIGKSKISGTVKGTIKAGAGILGTLAWVALRPADYFIPVQRRLAVFLKTPVTGRVKTRLASDIGEENACAVYRACVETTLERLDGLVGETVLYVDEGYGVTSVKQWLGPHRHYDLQKGGDLGRRLKQAAKESFDQGIEQLVFIGTDSPWIGERVIQCAFNGLQNHDVVIGPAEDGGYYLIGMKAFQSSLFDRIDWGGAEVFAQTMQRAGETGLSVGLLAQGIDIDRLADIQKCLLMSDFSEPMAFLRPLLEEGKESKHAGT